MNENPLVTICFLTYNYAPLMEKSLQPLINQSYTNTEVIISDNQSTDPQVSIIAQKLARQYPHVRYRYNTPNLKKEDFSDIAEKNSGDKKSYDVVFNHCNTIIQSGEIKGDFVIFCHQDDLYKPDIIKEQVAFLLAHPQVPCVFTQGNIINQSDTIIRPYLFPKELRDKNVYHFAEIFKAIMNHGNFLIAPSFMFRKTMFDTIGLFDDHGPFGGSDDLEMWLRILESYPIGIIHEPLIHWRTEGRGKKYHKLRTEKADFFKVMDYYLYEKKYAAGASAKDLRQYEFQKDFDNTLQAMNLLLKEELLESQKRLGPLSFNIFRAYFENMTLLRTKGMVLKIILLIGMKLGLEKLLGKILYRFT
ncbi:MAG: glycosyltransferase [Candidatus Staskawiczbacteria bacterium]|nr:glycosyltransferase [Candidatus Staskawiczbacteria bacterium]